MDTWIRAQAASTQQLSTSLHSYSCRWVNGRCSFVTLITLLFHADRSLLHLSYLRRPQVTSSGNDIFLRNPRNIDENLFVDMSSPSSSRYESVIDLGTPQEVGAGKVRGKCGCGVRGFVGSVVHGKHGLLLRQAWVCGKRGWGVRVGCGKHGCGRGWCVGSASVGSLDIRVMYEAPLRV